MSWLMIIVTAASLLLSGGGVAYASSDALPGDALYSVKNVIQDVGLAFSDDEGDIDLLLGFMHGNIDEMNQLAEQGRWDDLEKGLQQFQDNLNALQKTRLRISYLDAHNEDALTIRVQAELHTQSQALLQLQTRLQDKQQLQEKIQTAIQQTDQGNVYGPSDGGAPEESGSPNGVGPGEPQGTQSQTDSQNQNGQPDGAGEPGNGAGQNGQSCNPQSEDGTGDDLEQDDPLCEEQGSGIEGEGKGNGHGGRPNWWP